MSKKYVFEFYPQPFDKTKPPVAPPNRTMTLWPFAGMRETKKSKKQTQEWKIRLDEYGERQVKNDGE